LLALANASPQKFQRVLISAYQNRVLFQARRGNKLINEGDMVLSSIEMVTQILVDPVVWVLWKLNGLL